MKTTRRGFLKSILVTAAAAAIAPQVLIEPWHGASDLTPRERDVVAEVMGMRRPVWPAWCPESYITLGRSAKIEISGVNLDRRYPDGSPRETYRAWVQADHFNLSQLARDMDYLTCPVKVVFKGRRICDEEMLLDGIRFDDQKRPIELILSGWKLT